MAENESVGQLVPPATPVSGSRRVFHRPELDVLRFCAFLLVFLRHGVALTVRPANLTRIPLALFDVVWNSGGYGLCLFFLLSSYLITEILLRERHETGSVHVKAFYIRRVLRIWPLYLTFLTFCFLLGYAVPGLRVRPSFFLAYLFLLGNYAFYHTFTLSPMGPLWSISVEEQFYLCWPFVARTFGARGLTLLSVLLIPLSIGWSCWLTKYADNPGSAIWTGSINEFECFAVGALLAILLYRRETTSGPFRRVVLLLLGIFSWACADGVLHFNHGQVDRHYFPNVMGFQLIVLGCALMFLSILGLRLGSWSKSLTYLGRISYGLYVFHIGGIYIAKRVWSRTILSAVHTFPLENLGILAIAFSVTVGIAALSYRYFEKRFLRLKDRFTFIQTRTES